MKKSIVLIAILAITGMVKAQELTSPDGRFILHFALNAQGRPTYQLRFENQEVI